MKKTQTLIVIIISLILSTGLEAQHIELSIAQKVAISKINNLGYSDSFQLKSNPKTYCEQEGNSLFHAFELEPIGYIIVSANQLLPPIIAYSFTNNYKSKEFQESALVDLVYKDLNQRMQYIDKISQCNKDSRAILWDQLINNSSLTNKKFDQWPPAGTTSTGGWLETNWSQSAPYNNFCPMDPVTNQRSVAGCPSVAISMLINYYETLNEVQFNDTEDDYYHSYSGRNYWVDDDFEEIDFMTFPDINAYFDTIADSYLSNSPLKPDEKSALVWACGVAAKQVYTSSISGTFGVNQAYDAFLRFGFNDAILLGEDDPSILEHFAQNMIEARPTLLAVVDPGVAGHNLVTDGYNTDGYYHLNFGWGGSYNGWYLIPDEIPYNLTVFEGVIVDIAYPPVNTFVAESNSEFSEIQIYPNPASDNITLDFNSEVSSDLQLEIVDLNGKICFQKQINRLVANQKVIIQNKEIGRLSSGVYFCNIKSEENIITKKIIIQ